jgi:hypothetical protein
MKRAVRVSVEREGPRVLVALREADGPRAVTLDLHRRGAACLAAQLAAVSGSDDEDAELECELRATLTLGDDRP